MLIVLVVGIKAQPAQDSAFVDITELGRRNFRSYTDKDGLPHNSITAIAYDQKGYLWAGTFDGAARYNGRNWRTFQLPNAALSNYVRAIVIAADGSIWFGRQDGGVAVLKDDQWINFDKSSGLPDNRVRSLIESRSEDGRSSFWAGTVNGLAHYENSRWSTVSMEPIASKEVWSLLETINPDRSRTLWVGTERGLFTWQNNQWRTIYVDKEIASNLVFSILEVKESDNQRVIWAGIPNGLLRWQNGSYKVFTYKDGLPNAVVRCLLNTVDHQGKSVLWIGTMAGLAYYQNGRFQTLNNTPIVKDTPIFGLTASPNSSPIKLIWVGCINGGLVRLDQGRWITFNTDTGLPNNNVQTFQETRSPAGEPIYWIGTGVGLAQYKDSKFSLFNKNEGLNDKYIKHILETKEADGSSVIWVSTFGGGITRYHNGSYKNYQVAGGRQPNQFVYLQPDNSHSGKSSMTALSFSSGLFQLVDEQLQQHPANKYLPSGLLQTMLTTRRADGAEVLYIGTYDSGLVRVEPDRATLFNTGNGFPSNMILSLLIIKDTNGKDKLWVGTGNGVVIMDLDQLDQQWQTLSDRSTPPLPNNFIYQIQEDKQHRIYLFTNKGVTRLTRNPAGNNSRNNASSNSIGDYQIYTFTTEDGLPSNQSNFGASMIDSRGRIWVGTIAGAAMLDVNQVIDDQVSKPLFLERVLIDQTEIAITDKIEFAYDENNFVFEYALLSYFKEGDTRFRIQLEGFDKKLPDWTTETSKSFSNLAAGKYTLKLWGKDYTGNISGPITLSFRIKPAPWLTWWAYTLYIFSIAGIISGGVYLRLRQLKNRTEELQKLVAERTSRLVKQRDEIVEKNNHILDSIRYAERIQKAILPNQDIIQDYFTDSFVLFVPKDIVSGDFYWFHATNDMVILAVADCTGHGVPGALMSMIGNALLSQIIVEKRITDPATILNYLDAGIRKALKQHELDTETQDGMDIALCCVDRARHKITFAGARRPFFYIDSKGELVTVKGDRRSIGGKLRGKEPSFTNREISYTNSITFYLTTDGYADQNSNDKPRLGSLQFKQILERLISLPMVEQRQALLNRFIEFKGPELQRDDITILGLKI